MRVEKHDVAAAHEARQIRQVVHGVEPHPEASGFANLRFLETVSYLAYRNEVAFSERGVVEHEQGRALELFQFFATHAARAVRSQIDTEFHDGRARVVLSAVRSGGRERGSRGQRVLSVNRVRGELYRLPVSCSKHRHKDKGHRRWMPRPANIGRHDQGKKQES